MKRNIYSLITMIMLLFSPNQATCNKAHEYTINLMWINRKLNEAQQYIYPAANEEELSKKFLKYVFKWASKHHCSVIYLWIDSLLTPVTAIKDTEKLIADHIRTHPEIAPIVLRDVRKLPHVAANPEVFSDKTPIFFRVDLLRIIAQVHDISKGITPYFVYSDFDIEPISREEIFDVETLHKLKTFGIVMMYHPAWEGFENGFSIVSNDNPNLLEAMTHLQIDLNIRRAYNALNGKFYTPEHVSEIMPLIEKVNNQSDNAKTSQKPLSVPHNYSINIIWINKKLKENQQYVHPGLNEEELQEHLLHPIFNWATMNPEAHVNLWFNSATTTVKAVNNTIQLIHDMHPELSNIFLRDIQELSYVQENSALFSQKTEAFQYWSLQVLTAMHEISNKHTSYCIFGNLLELDEYKDLFNLKSLSTQDLFDEQAMKDLQKFGITITCKGGLTKGIIGGNTSHLFEVLACKWLKPNSEKAYNKLHNADCCGTCCESIESLQQIIWASYPNMFKYFYHNAGFGKLIIENFDHRSGKFITHEYDKDKDGLTPFGLDRIKFGGNFNASPQLPETGIGSIWIPTKKIEHSKPTLVYEDTAPVRKWT